MEDNEPEEVTGYFYTHIDCPSCQYVIMIEGDARGEEVTCPDCKYIMECTEVR